MPENNIPSIICHNVNSTTFRLIRLNRRLLPSNAFTIGYIYICVVCSVKYIGSRFRLLVALDIKANKMCFGSQVSQLIIVV